MTSEPLPRGALKAAMDAVREQAWGANLGDAEAAVRIALGAALPVIEKHARRRAAEQMELLEAIAFGYACPACHGKPAVIPGPRDVPRTYKCGCGHTWEPPVRPDYGMTPQYLVPRMARTGTLPDLPPKIAAITGPGAGLTRSQMEAALQRFLRPEDSP